MTSIKQNIKQNINTSVEGSQYPLSKTIIKQTMNIIFLYDIYQT